MYIAVLLLLYCIDVLCVQVQCIGISVDLVFVVKQFVMGYVKWFPLLLSFPYYSIFPLLSMSVGLDL